MKIIGAYESESEGKTIFKTMVWPDSVMVRSGKPVFIPDGYPCRLRFGICARIDAVGKSIAPRFAGRYYAEVAPMAFLMPDSVSETLEKRRDPLACDITADYSVICGDFCPAAELPSRVVMTASVSLRDFSMPDGVVIEENRTFDIDDIKTTTDNTISIASVRNTLKTGDIVCTMLPGSLEPHFDGILKIYFDRKTLLVNKLK